MEKIQANGLLIFANALRTWKTPRKQNAAKLSATMGLAFASTGVMFPFFAPILGWLGVFLTGSDTSLAMVLVLSVLTLAQAYVLKWMLP